MNKLFRPKCLRRVLLCLALLFPIVYLCGGLFFALTGSHGNYDWHENTLVNRDYNEAMKTENFKYSDWEFNTIDYGTRLGFTHGFYNPSSSDEMYFYFNYLGVNADGNGSNNGLGFSGQFVEPNYFGVYLSTGDDFTVEQFYVEEAYDFKCYAIFYSVSTSNYASIFLVQIDNSVMEDLLIYSFNPESNTWVIDNIGSVLLYSYIYFDDGKNLPDGSFELLPNSIKDYMKPILKPIESNSLSDYIFSQPFESNNFITSLGKDLINGSTKGFAPMNDMFRFINSNMLHFESTDGLAMFGLGYIYYAVNVLIIYEILILAVKLIMLPLRAVEIFNKSEDL